MSELAKALLEFQKKTTGFEADSKGARSQYASIGAVINNIKQATQFGLCFTQEVDFEGQTMFVRTVMHHISGEKRESRYPIWVDDMTNNQKIGGAITYAKRYALASMFGSEKGVDDADDDGEINGNLLDPPKETQVKAPPVGNSLSNGATPAPQTNPPAGGAGTSFDQLIETYPDEISRVASFEQGLSLIEKILKEAETPKNVTDFFNVVRPTDAKVLSMFSTRKEELDGAKQTTS